MRLLRLVASWLLFLAILVAAAPRAAAEPLDIPIPGGHFYQQTNGQGGAGNGGFAVTDDGGVPFWTEFRRLGGVEAVGYPVSRRFVWDGFLVQAFQKLVLQWQPGRGMFVVNVYDRLSAAGLDSSLDRLRITPPNADWTSDRGLPFDDIVERHLAILDVNPAVKARYFADSNPITHFGLPMGFKDYGSVFVIRTQRAALQQWQTDVPWARAGQVVVANGGDLAKEAGLFPANAIQPELVPSTRLLPDPSELESGLRALDASGAEGPDIVSAIRSNGTPVRLAELGPQIAGAYLPERNLILVNERFQSADPRTLGAVIAHEGWHLVQDRVLDQQVDSAVDCLRLELDAFGVEVRYWGRVFPGGKPEAARGIEADLNFLLGLWNTVDPNDEVIAIARRYLTPGQPCSLQTAR